MKRLTIPTERDGTFLKEATEFDYNACLLADRNNKATDPFQPRDMKAHDHQAYLRVKNRHERAAANVASFGVWDTTSYLNNLAFIGFASIKSHKEPPSAELDTDLLDQYKDLSIDYEELALKALTRYAHEDQDFYKVTAEVKPNSIATRCVVESLGFVAVKQKPHHIIYEHIQPIDIYVPTQRPMSEAA
jgi:predicted RNA binding protein YcfA (HicA-like mRNA interferase family)